MLTVKGQSEKFPLASVAVKVTAVAMLITVPGIGNCVTIGFGSQLSATIKVEV
jgi:hypothetical protein